MTRPSKKQVDSATMTVMLAFAGVSAIYYGFTWILASFWLLYAYKFI